MGVEVDGVVRVAVEVGNGLAVGVGVAIGKCVEVGEGEGNAVGIGDEIGFEVGDGVGGAVVIGDEVGVGLGVGVNATFTVNMLLVPVWVPSAAVILTPKPAIVTVTEVVPTPSVKAFIMSGLIDPVEYVKDGVPE